jgi:hypothetical protein
MSEKRPTRATVDGRAYLDLQNAARASNRDTAEFLALFALERFLARLSISSQSGEFVLKGGMLLAAYSSRRPTRDIDFQATNFSNDVDEVVDRVRAIALIELDDGMNFDAESVRGENIREDDEYAGVRVTLNSSLATAEIQFHVDVNFGDPIWPKPQRIQVPLLLGGEITVNGYPIHMILAEKIVTAISRGVTNTRWRDFLDIVTLTQSNEVVGSDLDASLEVVSQYRKVPRISLASTLQAMDIEAQSKWSGWRRRLRLDSAPERFIDVLDECIAFADPAIVGEVSEKLWRDGRWVPDEERS